MPVISKITLPSGNTYDIKDAYAREAIASLSGGSYFLGVTTTPLTDDSTTNPIVIDGESVYAINGNIVVYNESEFIWATTEYQYFLMNSAPVSGDTYKYWYTLISNPSEEFKEEAVYTPVPADSIPTTEGDAITTPLAGGAENIKAESYGHWVLFGDLSNLGDLAYHDDVVLNKGNAATDALTPNATFTVTQPTISVTPSTTNIKATASGAAVSTSSSVTVMSGIEAESAEVVRDIEATASFLETTTITPTNGTESVSKLGTVTKKYIGTSSIPITTPKSGVSFNAVNSAGSASTWTFNIGSGTDAETLVISGANSVAPTTLSVTPTDLMTSATRYVADGSIASTAPTVNPGVTAGQLVDAVPSTSVSVAKVGTAVTVATGSTTDSGSHGDSVLTSVGTDTTTVIDTITPSTTTVLPSNTAFSVTQPTVSLSTDSSAGTGKVTVATGISAASASGTAVSAANQPDTGKVGVAKYSDLSITIS